MLTAQDARVNHLADRVRDERLRLKMSVREAARIGGISNTWWQKFEDGTQPLTAGIIDAVAKTFGWSANWPDTLSRPDELEELRARVAELAEQVGYLLEREKQREQRSRRAPRRRAEDTP